MSPRQFLVLHCFILIQSCPEEVASTLGLVPAVPTETITTEKTLAFAPGTLSTFSTQSPSTSQGKLGPVVRRSTPVTITNNAETTITTTKTTPTTPETTPTMPETTSTTSETTQTTPETTPTTPGTTPTTTLTTGR